MCSKLFPSLGSPLFVFGYQNLRNSYIKKLFLDFGQGAKLDLLVIVELGFVGSSGIWGTVFLR